MKLIKKFLGKNKTSKPSNSKPQSDKFLTAKEIAEELDVDRRLLERTFIYLGWAEKTGRGAVATQEGVSNGAKTKYNDMTRNNYVMWNEEVLENETLRASLQIA